MRPLALVAVLLVLGGVASMVAGLREEPDARPSFLVIAPDTFRADRLTASLTPNLDALGRRGVVFDRMYSQSGWTMPAITALLTGRYPLIPEGGNAAGLRWLPEGARTLPELLSLYGYRTAAFWGASVAGSVAEVHRGFSETTRQVNPEVDYDDDPLDWLDAGDRAPFFLLVHHVDLQHSAGDALQRVVTLEQVFARLIPKVGRPAAMVQAAGCYDDSVRRYDALVGRMLAHLERVAPDTVVIFTSNHGVDLGEHGGFQHGTAFDTNLHVPLIIADPAFPTGRVGATVQTVDLAPTILARAGIPADHLMDGRSLLPLLSGDGVPEERDVFSVNGVGNGAIRTPRHKLVRLVGPAGGVTFQLFDLVADPGEQANVFSTGAPEEPGLLGKLQVWWEDRLAATHSASPVAVDPAMVKQMKREGYWAQVDAAAGAGPGSGPRDLPRSAPRP